MATAWGCTCKSTGIGICPVATGQSQAVVDTAIILMDKVDRRPLLSARSGRGAWTSEIRCSNEAFQRLLCPRSGGRPDLLV